MDSQQILMIVSIVATLSAVMNAIPVMAQNMTSGNMTGQISGVEGEGCPVSAEGTFAEYCAPEQSQDKGQDRGQEESCPVSAEGVAFCPQDGAQSEREGEGEGDGDAGDGEEQE